MPARRENCRGCSIFTSSSLMFVDIDEFARDLASASPAAALVTWQTEHALAAFLSSLSLAIRKAAPGTQVKSLPGIDLDSDSFRRELIQMVQRRDAGRTCLVVHDIEELVSAAGAILNGSRELFVRLRAIIIAIRENRVRDLAIACPDLMDWIGVSIARADDLSPPLRRIDIERRLRRIEKKYNTSSDKFVENRSRIEAASRGDAWLWSELLAIRSTLSQ